MTRRSQRLLDLKKSSSDEWYTRREDVALALDHLELNGHPVNGLRVLCPCDTPASAFVRELTARGAHVAAEWGAFQTLDMTGYDLIATNPPFSIFTAFYKAVRQSGSPFLILAPLAACAYKDVFNDIRDRRVTAFSTHPTSYRFTRPGGTTGNAPCCWLTSHRVPPCYTVSRPPAAIEKCLVETPGGLWRVDEVPRLPLPDPCETGEWLLAPVSCLCDDLKGWTPVRVISSAIRDDSSRTFQRIVLANCAGIVKNQDLPPFDGAIRLF